MTEHAAHSSHRSAPARDEQNRTYYDDFSGWYERERGRGYHGLIDDLEMQVLEPIARGAKVLEAGCGTGLILERIARVAKEAHGFDLSPGMLEKARERGLSVKLGSVTEVPYGDNEFDVVCSFKVLAHVPDIEAAVRELARVTKPGGRMVLEFYNPWSLRYLAKRVAGPQPISEDRTEADVFTRWDSPSDVLRLIPGNVELESFRGVRVVTPFAGVHRLPLVSGAIRLAESALVDSKFARFGGFLVAVLRKHS
jgi:ubiquinone/menaquinone biosynthesis C-methylase UbiE